MSAAENAAARIDADLYFPAHVKTLYQKFSVDAGEKIDGHDTYLVTGRSEGQPPLRLYMDMESGLMLRLVRYAENSARPQPNADRLCGLSGCGWREGALPLDACTPGNRFTIQVEEIRQNVPVDDSKFAPATGSTETFDSLIQGAVKTNFFDGIDTSSRLILAIGKTSILVRQILNLTRNKEGLTLPAI